MLEYTQAQEAEDLRVALAADRESDAAFERNGWTKNRHTVVTEKIETERMRTALRKLS